MVSHFLYPAGLAQRFGPAVRSLAAGPVDLTTPALELGSEGPLRVAYVPFDLIRPQATVVIVGLTPGPTGDAHR